MAASTAIMHSASTNGHLVAGSAGALGSSANSPDSSCPENRSNPSTSSSSEEEDDSHHPVQSLCTKSSPSKVPPAPSKPSVDNADSALVMTSSDDDEVVHDAKTCETVIVESGTDVLHSPKAPTITPPPSSTAEEADDNSTIIGDNDDEDDSQQSIEIDSPLEQPTKAVSVSSDTTTVNAPLHHSDHSVASPSAVSSLSVSFNLSSSLPTKKVSTGKLEKITERLAKKQSNGQIPTNLLESLASLRESASSPLTSVNDDAESIVAPSSVAPPESSATTISEDGDEDDVDEEDDDLDEEDEDEGMMMDDEEDSEEIKNGFMALGLMGNVAFMGEEKFKCPVCGLQLDSQHTFTLHIRSHNPNDHSNTCRLCGKTLSSASSLDRHMLIHSGERPFKCSICNMAFTTNGNMHRHMRTHGHGTIGYTPRGAKRRAKLFAQQAAKVAAAAAAGEPVDAATISKLKKSALEVTTGNGKSPISGTPMKKQRGGRRSSSDPFGGAGGPPALDSAGSNPAVNALEAGRIAEAAAAFAAAVAATSEPSTKSSHKSASKNTHSLGASHSHHTPSMPPSATSSPNVPINLAAFAAGWPELAHLQASNPQSVMPQIVPQKGKPGRKKKIRPDMMQPQQQQHHQHAQQHQQQQQSLSHSSPEMSPFPQGTFANLQPTVCPICAMSVRSKMDLHVHMANFHAGEKLFCLDCGMILDNYNIYTQHHCTVTAPAVMTALSQNPAANADLLFRSTNTSRMNFSSARYPPGMSGASAAAALGNTPLAPHNSANLPQDALGSLISQLNKTLSQQVSGSSQFGHHSSKDPFAFHQQTPPPAPSAPLSRSHHHQQGPSLDLSSKSSQASMSPAHSFRGGQSCNQCNQKFLNTKHLKHHIDTFCHQCSLDCVHEQNYQAHLFQHSLEKFPALSKALGGGKGPNGFNSAMMAAAFPALMSQVNGGNPLMAFSGVGAPVGALQQSSANFHKRNSYPKANSSPLNPVSLDLSISSHSAASSIASLTSTMADMKPDLADIQSIISMTKHAKLPSITSTTASTTSTNTYKSTPMSLSPNRASDAGIDMKKAVRTGDATNHPDSPASADSAAAAVVASSNGTNNGSQLATTHSLTADSHHHSKSGSSHLHEGAKTSNGSAAHHHDQLDDSFNDEEDEGELDDSLEMPSHKSRRRSGSPMKGDGGKSGHHSPNSSTQRFRCEQCRLSFKSMNAFRRHNRGHTAGGGHSHACHLCPYKSLDKSTLIRHLRTHNGERPFQCAICKYAFTTKANCERHVRKRHRNLKSKSEIRSAMQYNRDMAATAAATKLVSEKIFIERDELPTSQDTVCKQCGVDFGANRELRAHLRVPNNPCSQQLKPFVCTICKIGFNTRNNCVRHIIKQHPATIEVTDEEAAKVAAAVTANGAGDATAESLLMVETGSNPSLSPNSGGHMSGHSGYSDRSFSGSDHGMSECESYGTFDEEPKSSPLVSPNSNASFAALCQVAAVEKRFTNGSKSPELLAKKAPEPFIPLNLTMKSEESEDNQEDSDVLDLSRPKRKATATVPNGLDLSVKIPKLNGNHSIKMEPSECEPSPLQHFRNQAAASNLLSLYGAAAGGGVGVGGKGAGMDNFMQDMNQAMAAFAAKSFGAGGHHHPSGGGISNETLANLMAQFHQHQQQQQFAAMKPSTIGNKNH